MACAKLQEAFYGCKSLTSVKLPDSLTSIGDYAFRNCENLESVKMPDDVYRGAFAFQNTKFASVEDDIGSYLDEEGWE